MQRDEENGVVVLEDRLRPVAVVDVPVEDRHPLDAELRLRPPRRDRNVVEEAEPHRAVPQGVVPRGTDDGETATPDRLDGSAGGQQSRFVARRRADRVRV